MVLLVLVVRRGALLIHVLWLVLWLLLTVRIKIVQLGTLKRRLEQSWIIVLGMLGGEICILLILVVLVRICLLMVRIVVLGRVIVVRVVCLGDISRWRVFEVFVRTQRCIEAGWVVDGNVSDVADCAGCSIMVERNSRRRRFVQLFLIQIVILGTRHRWKP